MNRFTISLITMGLLASMTLARAEHEGKMKDKDKGTQRSATAMIGKKVINHQNEELGKIQDLIVNVEAGTAPYAIISTEGADRSNLSRIAVPLNSLQCSEDGKFVKIAATRDEFHAAKKTAGAEWSKAGVVGEWSKEVDGYYGQPGQAREREVRDRSRDTGESRTFVRDPQPKGGELLLTPQDMALCEKVCEAMDATSVRVENGTVHLYGTVASEEARKDMELKARSVPGVARVESHLKVKNNR